MIFTALTLGRRLVSRGRSAGDELGESLREIGSSVDDLLSNADRALTQFSDGPRTRKAPIVLAGVVAAVGGYLVGRKAAGSNEPETGSSYGSSPRGAQPNAGSGTSEASTAVASSRPQPPEAESAPVKAAQEALTSSSAGHGAPSRSGSSNGEAASTAGVTKPKSAESASKKPSSSTKAAPKSAKPSES